MSKKPPLRIAARQSRPHPDRLLTFIVVLTRRTFRWTVRRKVVLWTFGVGLAICGIAILGSGYGLWATKKIMDFGDLQRETKEQQEQLRESLEQADTLQHELAALQALVDDLMKRIDPRASTTGLTDSTGADGDISTETSQKVSSLKNELDHADDRLGRIKDRMAPVINRWNETPSIAPTVGTITSRYGYRVHPFFRTNDADDGFTSFHSGIDISSTIGTPIQATANGVVDSVEWRTNYGLTVIIRHSKEFETLYAHLSSVNVRTGQEVKRGDVIAYMGRTGRATGVHLHYEVKRNGQSVNPSPYLRLQLQQLTGLK